LTDHVEIKIHAQIADLRESVPSKHRDQTWKSEDQSGLKPKLGRIPEKHPESPLNKGKELTPGTG
jgi:hypothetical protein